VAKNNHNQAEKPWHRDTE